MNNEYKVIPFAEVKIGQEFEFKSDLDIDGSPLEFTSSPWTKSLIDEIGLYITKEYIERRGVTAHLAGCLVRTADCEPIQHCWEGGTKATCDCPDCGPCLVDYTETPEQRKVAEDFDTWWDREGEQNVEWTDTWVESMCKAAWDAAKAN